MPRFSKEATVAKVFVGDEHIKNALVTRVTRVTGARRINTATFELAAHGKQVAKSEIEDSQVTDLITDLLLRTEEVHIEVPARDGGQKIIHAGNAYRVQIQHDRREVVTYESRLEPHSFGPPLKTVKCPAGFTSTGVTPLISAATSKREWHGVVDLDYSLVFNPTVDGMPFPNMSIKQPKAKLPRDMQVFVSQDQLDRVAIAKTLPAIYSIAGKTSKKAALLPLGVNFWNLTDAVHYLLQQHLDGTKFVSPLRSELLDIFGDDPNLIRSHKLSRGRYLPHLLDELISPYGFEWYVDYPAKGFKEIKFYRRNEGGIAALRLPRYGETVDLQRQDTVAMRITADLSSRAANIVTVRGDVEEVEASFILVPAWEASHDSLSAEELTKDKIEASPELARVYRDWVANEGGDYTNLRSWYHTPDLRDILGEDTTVRRRKPFPMISADPTGRPFGDVRGCLLEWWDGATWKPLSDLTDGESGLNVKLLTEEIGVRFDADQLEDIVSHGVWSNVASGYGPQELRVWGTSTEVNLNVFPPEFPWKHKHTAIKNHGNTSGLLFRLTCTVRTDRQIEHKESSLVGKNKRLLHADKEIVIDSDKRFKKRTVSPYSVFGAGRPRGVLAKRMEVDDTSAMEQFAKASLETANQASLNGTITQPGCDFQELLGKSIWKIQGRNVGLRTSPGHLPRKYATVTQVEYDLQGQTTTLHLDTIQK